MNTKIFKNKKIWIEQTNIILSNCTIENFNKELEKSSSNILPEKNLNDITEDKEWKYYSIKVI